MTEGSGVQRANLVPRQAQACSFITGSRFRLQVLHSCKINVSTLDIRAQQLYPQLVPNIHSLLPIH